MKRLLARIAIYSSSIVVICLPVGLHVYRARRPIDMPAESTVWIKSPLPFGGWWLGCWVDSDQQSNRCRVFDRIVNPSIVYEGRYVACEGDSPVPLRQLKIKSPRDSRDMWLRPDGVAVVLQDGRLLVPAEDRADCAKIRAQLEDRHELPRRTSP
jgi:hypothetical protein